jgi:Ca-activated chloride channel family protein
MNFANPHLLWLLALIPPGMVLFFVLAYRRRQRLLTRFISSRLLPGLLRGVSPRLEFWHMSLQVLAVIALILALARPQWGFEWEEVRQRGLDIVVAIDTSKSMLAEDIAPSRLERAKLAAMDLLRFAKNDRLGLVAFSGGAFLQCPLTIDDSAFRQSVEALDVNVISQGGTSLADAIETSLAAFKEADNFKALILLTDGEDNEPGALEAADKAARAGLKIFTVGIGSPEGEVLRVRDAKGRTDYIRDEKGNPVNSRLNEDLLKQIAAATKGAYLPLKGPRTMEMIYQQGLAPMPKSESEEKLVRHYREQFKWPLLAAFVLLIIEMLLPERKSSRRNRSARRSGNGESELTDATEESVSADAPVPPLVAALCLLLLGAAPAQASPSSALREYKAGKYDKAYEEYKKLSERDATDPRLHFNAGASAYQSKQFKEAVKEFNDALATPDLKLQQQAYYNLGNTLYHLGEGIPDPSKKMETWQNSLSQYESTLRLNPNDPDAKHNLEYVKRLLEELKKQQQQQQKSDDQKKDQDKNQDKQDQKQDSSQDKKDKDDKSQQDQKQNQGDKSGDQQKKDAQKDQDQKQQEQAKKDQADKDQKQKEQEKADQQKASPDKQDQQQKDDESQQEMAQNEQAAPGQMTPQQARQLLEGQKSHELLMPAKKSDKRASANRVFKDW